MAVKVSVDVLGEKAVLGRLEAIGEEIEQKVQALIATYATRVERSVKRRIAQYPATGKTYQRGGVTHQASAPGEPPATDTGRLASSIHHVLEGMAAQVIAGDAEVEYAAALEAGTDHIAPRPYMKPSLEEHKADFIRDLKAALKLS